MGVEMDTHLKLCKAIVDTNGILDLYGDPIVFTAAKLILHLLCHELFSHDGAGADSLSNSKKSTPCDFPGRLDCAHKLWGME